MAVVTVVPVVSVVPSDGVTDVHVCASDGISLRMCEDNTSYPVEMPKLHLYPPDYKVVCFCKKLCFFFLFVYCFAHTVFANRGVFSTVHGNVFQPDDAVCNTKMF